MCGAGSSYNYSLGMCSKCPAGTTTMPGVNGCTKCSAGFYSYRGSAQCEMCSPGTYSAADGTKCISCPLGSYSLSGASTCLASPAGHYSPSSSYFSSCTSAGAPGATDCDDSYSVLEFGYMKYWKFVFSLKQSIVTTIKVPAGFTQYRRGKQVLSTVYMCPEGYYSSGGGSSCQPCTTAFLPGAAICHEGLQSCAAGFFRSSSSGVCESVAPGLYNPFLNSGAAYLCNPGSFSLGGSSACQLCSLGTYSSHLGASACKVCPTGYTSYEGYSYCYECSAGTYSVAGICIACPPGTTSGNGASSCDAVSAGTYSTKYDGRKYCEFSISPGAINCDVNLTKWPSICGAGNYRINGHCKPAPAGYYTPVPDSTILYICPIGTYSTGGSSRCAPCQGSLWAGAAYCSLVLNSQCPAGSYPMSGGTCSPVPAGFFSPFDNSLSYYSCPSDSLSNGGAKNCTLKSEICSSYTAFPNEVNQATCGACPGNSFYSGGKCIFCSPGYMAGPNGNCMYSPHSVIAHPGLLTGRVVCPPGSYASEGSVVCSLCSAGSTSNGTKVFGQYCKGCNYGAVGYGMYSGMIRCPGITAPNVLFVF